LITFDDGYAALARHAFPLLLKYGLTACVFVVTDRLGKTGRTLRRHKVITCSGAASKSPTGLMCGLDFGVSRPHPRNRINLGPDEVSTVYG
jgi:Polysaccharide deacetylase